MHKEHDLFKQQVKLIGMQAWHWKGDIVYPSQKWGATLQECISSLKAWQSINGCLQSVQKRTHHDIVRQIGDGGSWPRSSFGGKTSITARANKPGVLVCVTHNPGHASWRACKIIRMELHLLKQGISIKAFIL
jgi:hypothetical protein